MIVDLLQILAGWAVADLLSGLYHLATDRGWNLPWFVREFQSHHARPDELCFSARWLLAGVPVLLFGWPSPFWLSLGVGVSLTQLSHQLSHGGPRCWPVRCLQRLNVILPPAHHAGHHVGSHGRNYCVLCGWVNPLLNLVTEESEE